MNRVQPNDIDAELWVLGSMLQTDGGAEAILEIIGSGLRASDFYRESHNLIFRAMMDIHGRGDPVDLYSVTKELENTNRLEKVGGISYLSDDLMDSIPAAANATHYAKQVLKQSQKRSIIRVSGTVHHKAYDPLAEPAELLSELQELISQERLSESIGGKIASAKDDWGDVFEQLCRFREREFIGLRTGFEKFDRATLGLRGLSVLGGIPGQGKSSFALQLAMQIANINNVPAVFYALEMSKFDLYVKAISRLSRLDYTTLMIGSEINGRRGRGLSEEDTHKLNEATSEFMEYADRVKIVDRSVCRDPSLSTLRLHIQQAKREHKADQVFVVVDHLQLFPCDRPELSDMKSRLDYLVAEFKAISEQYNATILLISEKNRQSYEREWLGAFMGTAGIEYGVDLAMLLHEKAEEQWITSICVQCKKKLRIPAPIPDEDRELELKIVKGRFTGRKGIKFKFYPLFSCFEEL